MFEVGGADAHAVAASRLKEAGAHVPRACLLRRVTASLEAGESFAKSLTAAGLRGDRLSVWALQVISSPSSLQQKPAMSMFDRNPHVVQPSGLLNGVVISCLLRISYHPNG
jgi:hypothetical protein